MGIEEYETWVLIVDRRRPLGTIFKSETRKTHAKERAKDRGEREKVCEEDETLETPLFMILI